MPKSCYETKSPLCSTTPSHQPRNLALGKEQALPHSDPRQQPIGEPRRILPLPSPAHLPQPRLLPLPRTPLTRPNRRRHIRLLHLHPATPATSPARRIRSPRPINLSPPPPSTAFIRSRAHHRRLSPIGQHSLRPHHDFTRHPGHEPPIHPLRPSRSRHVQRLERHHRDPSPTPQRAGMVRPIPEPPRLPRQQPASQNPRRQQRPEQHHRPPPRLPTPPHGHPQKLATPNERNPCHLSGLYRSSDHP